jgi:hypothetical protein
MKTAMQELLQILESKILPCDDDNSYVYGMNVAHANLIYNIKNGFLEKEKEQIIQAANNGALKSIAHKEKLDKMSEDELRDSLVKDTISYGDEYYNQTYNQTNNL